MVANRDRVEHAITESLNGAQIGDPVNAMRREIDNMRRSDPQHFMENLRLFERMTRDSALLPHLDLTGMPEETPRNTPRPHQPARNHAPDVRRTAEIPRSPAARPAEQVVAAPAIPGLIAEGDRQTVGESRPNPANPLFRDNDLAGLVTSDNQRRNAHYTGRTTTDQNGQLRSAQIDYENAAIVRLPGLSEPITNVGRATINYNPTTRSYTTELLLGGSAQANPGPGIDGRLTVVTDANGRSRITSDQRLFAGPAARQDAGR